MVRRDEQPRQNRATLLLDTRSSVHRGSGAGLQGSSFEWAVSTCASIAVWLARRGYLLQLVTTGGIRAAGSTPAIAESNILELLSIVSDSREAGFRSATASMANTNSGRTPGLVVAIVGVPADPRMGGLDGLPPRPDSGIAVTIDTGSWGAHDDGGDSNAMADATRVLAASSWRVVAARRGDALADLWPQAGMRIGAPSAGGRR
jgi:uncharacterized protein (DUF58 family)